jgi:single-strand DNA-binding protein
MGINKVILVGNLGNDPEIRYTPDGTAVATFSLATNYAWKVDGKTNRGVDWHRVKAWGRRAEICGEYLKGGSQVYIEGKLKTKSWEKDGQRRWMTEVVATEIQFLSGKKKNEEEVELPPAAVVAPSTNDDDIPF